MADMKGKGFERNPYDPCMENKMSGGKKMEVFWNVYDLKVSHVDPKKFTKFTEWLVGIYGKMKITRGKLQE